MLTQEYGTKCSETTHCVRIIELIALNNLNPATTMSLSVSITIFSDQVVPIGLDAKCLIFDSYEKELAEEIVVKYYRWI